MTARRVGLGLLGVALLLLLGSCSVLQRAYDFRADGRECKGRVVERDLDGGTLTISRLPILRSEARVVRTWAGRRPLAQHLPRALYCPLS